MQGNLSLYDNQISPEELERLDLSPFSEQQIADFSEDARAIIHQTQDYVRTHPPIAIYRFATEGSLTLRGGVVQNCTGPLTFELANGKRLRSAHEGDEVVYPDGRTARIITGAGKKFEHVALVGSRLCNGDEISATLQNGGVLVVRHGVPMPEDFLPPVEA